MKPPEIRNVEREKTTIRLPGELKEQLQREAQERGVSFNEYVLWIIRKGRKAE